MSTRQAPKLVDNHGREIHLGEQLGKGGQGRVHAVNGDPTKAAKIYLNPTTQSHDAKLNAMVSMANDELFAWGAWPSHTLHLVSGKPVGFLMPRIDNHRTMYDLFHPKMRAKHFPGVDWRFMFAAATNMARAFAFAHQTGLVIGDVNDGNLLVAKDATCKFLDFDSCQISYWGHQWLCEVGTKEYQPPEMRSNKTPRTPNYDNFGLAVMIFELLFAGRHPFFGVYQSSDDAPDVVEAIRDFRYAYSEEPSRTLMLPPPNALSIEAVPAKIRNMFELAFSPAGVGGRPSASDWVGALRGIGPSLRQCTHNPAHYYHWEHCHWCDIEANSGVSLFSCVAPPPPPSPPTPSAPPASWNWPPIPPSPPKPRRPRPRPVVQPPVQPIPPAQPTPKPRPWYQAPPGGIPPQAPTMPANQPISWQVGWLIGKAWGSAKAFALVHPYISAICVLLCLSYVFSNVSELVHRQQSIAHPLTAQSTGFPNSVVVSNSPPAPVAQPAPPPAPPVAPLPAPHDIASPPPSPVPPAPLPRVVTPYTPPPPPVAAPVQPPIQPDITLPALRPPTPQTALPALRPPATQTTDLSTFHVDRVGPSFDCAKAHTPVFQLICSDEALARSNSEMMQPFYVLGNQFQFGQGDQIGQAGWKNLTAELTDFYDQTFTLCGVDPKDGAISGTTADLQVCLNRAFKNERALWMSRLQAGDGLEEATRNIEHHIALQYQLKLLGYIAPTDRTDGNYGPNTRKAIVSWQTASSLPPTGLLSNSQVSLLLQSQPAANPVTEPAAFLDGQRDRRAWEFWFTNLEGEVLKGADYWASHRSMPHPSCSPLTFEARIGCIAASGKLAPFDARRKADSDYRRGWNTY